MKPDVPEAQVLATLPELGLPVGPKRQKGVAAANRVLPAMRKRGSPLGQVTEKFDGGHPMTLVSGLLYSCNQIAPGMEDLFLVMCPYCGQQVEIYLEPDVKGSFVQDCEICCNPWRVRVSGRGADRHVDVARADGSE